MAVIFIEGGGHTHYKTSSSLEGSEETEELRKRRS